MHILGLRFGWGGMDQRKDERFCLHKG